VVVSVRDVEQYMTLPRAHASQGTAARATSVEHLGGGVEAWLDVGFTRISDAAPAPAPVRERRVRVATSRIPLSLERRRLERPADTVAWPRTA